MRDLFLELIFEGLVSLAELLGIISGFAFLLICEKMIYVSYIEKIAITT